MSRMKTGWYKNAVIYQIYPRSFCDSNGDGIGDLNGILSKIPYLKSLGIDAVWLSPCYASPNDDNGYDISDYREIMAEFGTMEDWKHMLHTLHENGIRLIMDLVVNHTSDEHRWFQESKKGRNNSYSDYYIWRDGIGPDKKTPPNRWGACFGGSAWEYCEERGQFYLHLFSKKQPDLNWENPDVRREVAEICNFWLEKGVDGFRCDVITYISKPDDLYHAPKSGVVVGPRWKEYIRELSAASWDRYDSMIVGEAAEIDWHRAMEITDDREHLLDTLFHFEHVAPLPVCRYSQNTTDLRRFKKILFRWQALPEHCWPSVYYENHDQPRSIPRFAPSGSLREQSAKSLAASLLFQKGTAFLYQGQELGMTNAPFREEDYRDIRAVNQIREARRKPLARWTMPFVLRYLRRYSRDHARTPMQWDGTQNAGFTTGTPWIMVNPNYPQINAREQQGREDSVFHFYQKALKVRKDYLELIRDGEFIPIDALNRNVMAYARRLGRRTLLVLCSLSPRKSTVRLEGDYVGNSAALVIGNSEDVPVLERRTVLQPCQCAVFFLEK